MPRPDPRAPKDGQADLFGGALARTVAAGPLVPGETTARVDAALAAAALPPEADALAAFLHDAAVCSDAFKARGLPYGLAKLLPGVTDAVDALGLSPRAQNAAAAQSSDAFVELLRAMEAGADGNAPASH